MNIAELLRAQARERPDAPAIIDRRCGKDRTTTFAMLEDASGRGASLLLAERLVPGDTVLVFQPMSAELYIALMALFRAGMTAMFLDPSAGRDHIERCCAIRRPAALIATPRAHLLRLVSPALRDIPRCFSFGRLIPAAIPWSRADRLPLLDLIHSCDGETPALITFTSGSTGIPKAAVRSHAFLREQHRVLARELHLVPGETDLTTLPVFALANLASGVTSLIPDADLRRPGAIRPQPVLRQIRRFLPTRLVASPAFVERLCDGSDGSGTLLAGFRQLFTGGAPVFPDQLDRFAASFPGADPVVVYGSTEAEPISHIGRHELTDADRGAMSSGHGLPVGMPVEGISVRIITARWGETLGTLGTEEFAARCLPAGEPGEIVVSGSHVLPGYLNGVGDEETKFRVDGTVWHRTGDSGYFDPHGRLWLLGRAQAVISDERGTLHPFAVECAARNLPEVRCAALLGRDGKRVLFVQPRSGHCIDSQLLRQQLAWSQLDDVRAVWEIPLDRRHNAKVDYNKLAALM